MVYLLFCFVFFFFLLFISFLFHSLHFDSAGKISLFFLLTYSSLYCLFFLFILIFSCTDRIFMIAAYINKKKRIVTFYHPINRNNIYYCTILNATYLIPVFAQQHHIVFCKTNNLFLSTTNTNELVECFEKNEKFESSLHIQINTRSMQSKYSQGFLSG